MFKGANNKPRKPYARLDLHLTDGAVGERDGFHIRCTAIPWTPPDPLTAKGPGGLAFPSGGSTRSGTHGLATHARVGEPLGARTYDSEAEATGPAD